MITTRLSMAIGNIKKYNFGIADTKGAFMHSGQAKLDIFIVPYAVYRKRVRLYLALLELEYGV